MTSCLECTDTLDGMNKCRLGEDKTSLRQTVPFVDSKYFHHLFVVAIPRMAQVLTTGQCFRHEPENRTQNQFLGAAHVPQLKAIRLSSTIKYLPLYGAALG
jgi:hypothetical protein